jgi:ABC-type antimicrobial peptide transport system permease subunit
MAMAVGFIVVVVGPTTTIQRVCKTKPNEVIATTFAKAALLVHNYYAE